MNYIPPLTTLYETTDLDPSLMSDVACHVVRA